MRDLTTNELNRVSGGGHSCYSPCTPPPSCDDGKSKHKNNNGYGNGPESGPPPGHSGDHNPQLTGWNSGPKGPR
jgi:hypothetical protein